MSQVASPIIQINQLTKEFRSEGTIVRAVDGINLEVCRQDIFGLLGPNGAGKTTTMRMLCTLLTPTSGTLKIDGIETAHNPNEVRKRIGYVSQKGGMEPDASGQENLILQGRLYGMNLDTATKRSSELIESLHLAPFADRKTKTYSGGQRRIFDLACSIIHNPSVLFLDEPTTGLDPQSRALVWQEVKKLNAAGTTVFITTHYLEEADELCQRVAIVDHGTIIALGSPSELKAKVADDIIILGLRTKEDAQHAATLINTHQAIKSMQANDAILHLYINQADNGDSLLPSLLKILHQHNLEVDTIQWSRPTLDDVFLKLTGRTMRDQGQ